MSATEMFVRYIEYKRMADEYSQFGYSIPIYNFYEFRERTLKYFV